jgi:hypothetical protein
MNMNNKLIFSDKMEFDLTGPRRIEERPDGLYVVGEGVLLAVATEEEGREYLDR